MYKLPNGISTQKMQAYLRIKLMFAYAISIINFGEVKCFVSCLCDKSKKEGNKSGIDKIEHHT